MAAKFLITPKHAAAEIELQQAKPWLGIGIEDHKLGALITRVIPETPAHKAKLMNKDIVTHVNKVKISSAKDLVEKIQSLGVGNIAHLELIRDKKTLTFDIALVARPEMLDIAKKVLLNKPAPDFDLKSTHKGLKGFNSTTDLKGKVTFLHFWATWCPACRFSHKPLNDYIERQKDSDFQLITISDEDHNTINQYIKKYNLKLATYSDAENKAAEIFRVSALPTIIIIDKKGIVREVSVGAGSYLENALKTADNLLKK